MSSDTALELHDISKRYLLGVSGRSTFDGWTQMLSGRTTMAGMVLNRLRHPLRTSKRDEFWALQDISFALNEGEVLGLVGRNGAGKSTLLKLISGITDPTKGRIDLYGRVGCLLEVGSGFHPELTGRENIYLNGAVLGMRRKEIDAQFDAIVEFSGVQDFLETPVKRFSSGMTVRLAFAIAAHLRTEILLVDEVLAVGDKAFRDRCLGKLTSVADAGRTVIYVSHLMETVTQLCTQAVLLEKGRLTMHGSAEDVVRSYITKLAEATDLKEDMDRRAGYGAVRVVEASAEQDLFNSDDEKVVVFAVERRDPNFRDHFFVKASIVDQRESVVFTCDSRLLNHSIAADGWYEGLLRIRAPWLKPGRYRVDFILDDHVGAVIDEAPGACFIDVGPKLPYPGTSWSPEGSPGYVYPDFEFESAG